MPEEKIKENIKKCARCALCVQNCPIYDIKKDENNTARGLICKLIGYEKKLLTQKEIKKDLKICLMCSKCKSNCPSKVNTTYAFGYKNAYFSPSKISQRLFLSFKLLPLKLIYFFNLLKKKKENKKNNTKIYYFKGCVAKAQHKTTFLDEICANQNFSCCGIPYLSGGDLKNYNKVKEKNIQLIKESSLIVFDCASCKSSVEEYEELSKEQKNKLIFFTDLLKEKKFKLKTNSKFKNKTIVFHKPCHMNQKDFLNIENFLSSIENLNYKKLENPDSCCGFGGRYFIFHPIISSKIALKKALTIKNSKTDYILTSCPSCTIGLRFGQLISKNFKKTIELRDFIETELEKI